MHKYQADVAVLGAGPAGAIAARHLGQTGLDVLLIDPGASSGGHDIESLPASGAPLAEDIGLLGAICEISEGPAQQMRSLWRDEPETHAFSGEGPLLLRRAGLHEVLRAQASRVTRSLRTRVRKITSDSARAAVSTDAGEVSCKMVIDARGRQANKRPASDLVALSFAARSHGPSHAMWLEAMDRCWIWASSLERGELHGVLFQQASVLSGLNAQTRLDYARACLSRSESFADIAALTIGRPSAAGLSAVEDPVLSARHVLVGDAALARDPIASHGLVHAMRSGVQGAVAGLTILDPEGDSHAARRFLRHKHSEAVTAARRATAQAYGEQSRFQSTFWTRHEHEDQPAQLPKIGSGLVTLAKPLTRAPVLERDRIRWAPAIELSAARDFFTGVGPVTALDIAAACRPSASLSDIAVRLSDRHATPIVFDVLEHLTLGGAFTQAVRPI